MKCKMYLHVKLNRGLPWQKTAFNKKKKTLFINTLDINLRSKLVKSYIWIIALYGTGTRTLQKVDKKTTTKFLNLVLQ